MELKHTQQPFLQGAMGVLSQRCWRSDKKQILSQDLKKSLAHHKTTTEHIKKNIFTVEKPGICHSNSTDSHL